jgi:hypothetical protein
MFSVENLLNSFDVLETAHISSAERNERACIDISSGREKRGKGDTFAFLEGEAAI